MKLVIFSLLMCSIANAGTTGVLNLSGTVASVYDLTVTPASASTSLNIISGESNLIVADVTEVCNNSSGYKITLSSANGGKLKNGTQETAYQLSYNGGSLLTPSTTPTTVKTVSSLTGLVTSTSQVKINVTAKSDALAGSYTDTVTLTIGAP